MKYLSIKVQLSQYSLVCINPDTTLSVILSMYQSRYKSLCILKYVLIQIGERVEYRMLIDSLYRGIVQTPYH